MTKYRCSFCKFRFDMARMPKFCPYCNRETVSAEETAEELIRDIDKLIE
ncbi:hypothetical protein HZA33_01995 [Candidatus Pacearchaeota archaeon]|nr:hypothetical protein [Candidatus Pacearchaeota archaeon]